MGQRCHPLKHNGGWPIVWFPLLWVSRSAAAGHREAEVDSNSQSEGWKVSTKLQGVGCS